MCCHAPTLPCPCDSFPVTRTVAAGYPAWMPEPVSGTESRTPGERLVEARVRSSLPTGGAAYRNVRWIAATRDGGPRRDGETDLMAVHPDHGILAVEVKDGPVGLDGFGRWFAGTRDLPESPFAQAEHGKWALRDRVKAHPGWHAGEPRMLHAVAFPGTDRESLLRAGRTDLGPEAPLELVLDRADLASDAATAAALERVFAYWAGDGSRDRRLSDEALAAIHDVIEPLVQLRPLLRGDLEAGEHELLAPTHHQLSILKTLRGVHRASIVGAAGSGKTLLAVEKARQLGAIGFNVLFVCFNAPLALAVADDPVIAPLLASGRLTVATFHELCRRLGHEARTLPTEPARLDSAWFSETLPRALVDAIPTVGGRWQALVIDEGQDFAPEWLMTLALLLVDPDEDDIYLFHDPAQALYRADASETLGLAEFPLLDNCRNARPIHDFAFRWYTGALESEPLREDGPMPQVVEAEAGEPTVAALRDVLNDLVKTEGIERERIAVLTGVALERSAVWHQRRFKGDLVLWNGSFDEAGASLGLPFDAVPPQPKRTILCETIHRFKGLERDVIVLVELRPEDERLTKLLYVGSSRAKHHLVVIATPELAQRFGRIGA